MADRKIAATEKSERRCLVRPNISNDHFRRCLDSLASLFVAAR
ncbi:hypothetical protein SH528x_001076 [Novipirellula sp. SH528]